MNKLFENWKRFLNETTDEDEVWAKIATLIEAGAVELAVNMIETLELKAPITHPIFQVIKNNKHKLGDGAWRLIMILQDFQNNPYVNK